MPVKTLMIYHMQHGTITPSSSPQASVVSSVKPNFTELDTRTLVDSLLYPLVLLPLEDLANPWITSSASAHTGAEPGGSQQGFQTKISINWRDEVIVKAAQSYILCSRCQLISFHLRLLQSISCSVFSEQLTHHFPGSAYPFNSLPAQIASIPQSKFGYQQKIKYLFNLISYPLNTNMGIKVEILQYYFIHRSFNTFVVSPRLLRSPEASKSHMSLSWSLPFAADEATARS